MKVKISAFQLFSAALLVPLGSALIFFITPEAKQDAWIAPLFYMLPAIILQIIYTALWKKYSQDSIITYMPKIFGKALGYPLSIIYIVFFAYEAARVLRDFQELISISLMPRMPPTAISIMLAVITGYSVYLGFENIFRAVHILLYVLTFYIIFQWVSLITTPHAVKLYNMKPFLEHGILSVIKKGWKLITFPYGESILFTMFLPYVVEASKVRKATVLAIISMAIMMSINTLMFISTLGLDFASTSLFPLLETLRIIRIGEAFDRVDIFIILLIVLIGYIKASFFLYGSMLGTAQLLKLKDTKYLAAPFTIALLVASRLIAKNYPQHIYIGQVLTLTYVHLPLAVIIPMIALLVYYIRNGGKSPCKNPDK